MTARPGTAATGDDPGDREFAPARTLAGDVFFPIALTTSEVGVTCALSGHPPRQVVVRPVISRRGGAASSQKFRSSAMFSGWNQAETMNPSRIS